MPAAEFLGLLERPGAVTAAAILLIADLIETRIPFETGVAVVVIASGVGIEVARGVVP